MSLWQRPNGPASIAASPSNQSGLNQQAVLASIVPGTLVLTGTVETVVPHPQNPAIPYICAVAPNEGNEAVPFDVVASGYVTTTVAGTVTLKIYSGTSFTVANDKLLGASAAVTQNNASAPFEIHLHLLYDSVSGQLTGYVEGLVNNTLITKAAISNVISGVKDTSNPVVNLLLSATSSAAAGATPTTVVIKNFTAG